MLQNQKMRKAFAEKVFSRKHILWYITLLIVCTGLLVGCSVKIVPKDRIGNIESESELQTANSIRNDKNYPVLQISYLPYTMEALAKWAFGLTEQEVPAYLNEYGELNLKPASRDDPFGNIGISIFTYEYGCVIRKEEGAYFYDSVINNAIHRLGDNKKNPYLNYEFGYQPSALLMAFPNSGEREQELSAAAGEIISELSEIGLLISEWSGVVADSEFWDFYYNSMENYEEEVFLYVMRQQVNGVTVENITGESVVYVAYSPQKKEILMVDTPVPAYGDILTEKKVDIISEEDAVLLGRKIIKSEYGLRNISSLRAEMVYIKYPFGGYDYDNRTVTLYPAWKISFQVDTEYGAVWDYILLDAESGLQHTNRSQLY